MILIADAGSTKTRWMLREGDRTIREEVTVGINAVQVTAERLSELLSEVDFGGAGAIRFYGAGCIDEETNRKMEMALEQASGCADIVVQSDIVGAAVGTLGKRRGIVCILGTGSNSALWSGEAIESKRNAGGYILGDEGSGAVMGRKLISDYVKGLTPEWMTEILEREYELDYGVIVRRVYREEMPNRWLAGFAKLLGKHREQEYVRQLVTSSFCDFVQRNVCQYEGWRDLECAFVGSVAFHFEKELREVCRDSGVKVVAIKQEPFA